MHILKNISSRFVMSLAALLVVSALGGCKKKEADADQITAPAAPAVPAPADPSATGTPSPTATGVPSPTATGTPSPTATGTPSPTATGTPSPTAAGTPSPTATGTPAPAAAGDPQPVAPAGNGGDIVSVLGQPCGANDACPARTTCKTYYGIAGPQGPAFKSCEIECDQASKNCPAGSSCVTIADGPGSVCRP